MPQRLDNLIGRRFGRLLVLERAATIGKTSRWLCRCDCGRTKIIGRDGLMLPYRNTQSCGCLIAKSNRQRKTIHGEATGGRTTVEYNVWVAIHKRCYSPTYKDYPRYGARGITVCDRWREAYANFLADMGRRPSSRHSLERIDNNGPYAPENCRWALPIDQANNRRNNRPVTFNGETLTISQWERRFGMRRGLLLDCLASGWTINDALTRSVQHHAPTTCAPRET